MPDTYEFPAPIYLAYPADTALRDSINHGFAHVRADAFGEPEPDRNAYCPYCQPLADDDPTAATDY